jgi:hypothetical protein
MAFPALVFVAIEVYLVSGHVLYAHGPSIYLVLLAGFVGMLAAPWEAFALVKGALHLRANPSLRTLPNVLCLAAAAIYLFGFILCILKFQSGQW